MRFQRSLLLAGALLAASLSRAEITNLTLEVLEGAQVRVTFDTGSEGMWAYVDWGQRPDALSNSALARQMLRGRSFYRAVIPTTGLSALFFRARAGQDMTGVKRAILQPLKPQFEALATAARASITCPYSGNAAVKYSDSSMLDGTNRNIAQETDDEVESSSDLVVWLRPLNPTDTYFAQAICQPNPYSTRPEYDYALVSPEFSFSTPALRQPLQSDQLTISLEKDTFKPGEHAGLKVVLLDSQGQPRANVALALRLLPGEIEGKIEPETGVTDFEGSFSASFTAESLVNKSRFKGKGDLEVTAGTNPTKRSTTKAVIRER